MLPSFMNPSAVVSRAAAEAWREVDGEVVVVSIDANRVRLLNDVGAFVWKRCDRATVRELVDAVHGAYACTWEVARADVERFVEDLAARGMLHVEEPG